MSHRCGVEAENPLRGAVAVRVKSAFPATRPTIRIGADIGAPFAGRRSVTDLPHDARGIGVEDGFAREIDRLAAVRCRQEKTLASSSAVQVELRWRERQFVRPRLRSAGQAAEHQNDGGTENGTGERHSGNLSGGRLARSAGGMAGTFGSRSVSSEQYQHCMRLWSLEQAGMPSNKRASASILPVYPSLPTLPALFDRHNPEISLDLPDDTDILKRGIHSRTQDYASLPARRAGRGDGQRTRR